MNPFANFEEWRLVALGEWLEISTLLQRSDVSHAEIVDRLESTAAILKAIAPIDPAAPGQLSLTAEPMAWIDGELVYSESQFDQVFAHSLSQGSQIIQGEATEI